VYIVKITSNGENAEYIGPFNQDNEADTWIDAVQTIYGELEFHIIPLNSPSLFRV
jgi:hypothetical protein